MRTDRLMDWTNPTSVLRYVYDLERNGQSCDDSERWKQWALARSENPDKLLDGLFWRGFFPGVWHITKHWGESRDKNDLLVPSVQSVCGYVSIELEGFSLNPTHFHKGLMRRNDVCCNCVSPNNSNIGGPRRHRVLLNRMLRGQPALYSEGFETLISNLSTFFGHRVLKPISLAVAFHPYDFELIKGAKALSLLRLVDVVDPRDIEQILVIEPDNCSAPIVADYQQQPEREVSGTQTTK